MPAKQRRLMPRGGTITLEADDGQQRSCSIMGSAEPTPSCRTSTSTSRRAACS